MFEQPGDVGAWCYYHRERGEARQCDKFALVRLYMYTVGLVFVTEITMKIGWLLLLQLLMVASQSTTDDDVCDGGLLRPDVATLSSQVQLILQQQQLIIKRFGKHDEAI